MRWKLHLVCLLALLPALLTHAQIPEEGDGPAVAMGNGRMVRGTVTAAAKDKLTVKTEEGEIYQVTITSNTQVRKGRDPVKFADVHPGDGIGAMGVLDAPNRTMHALMLVVVDAEQVRKGREAMGKTLIWGKVTAIDELKITVLRQDKVSQVIAVDEDTSFRRGRGRSGFAANSPAETPAPGGESITLMDVKVGDIVAGPGALKAGIFVPTQLLVMDPTARRRRPDSPGNASRQPETPQ